MPKNSKTTARESRLPTVGASTSSRDNSKRRSLLPAPKTLLPSKIKSTSVATTSGSLKQTTKGNPSATTFAVPPSVNQRNFVVGDKCTIGIKKGCIRYFGKVHFAEGDWCGIEFSEPEGKHDGLVEGVRYFSCCDRHGLFAPVSKVELISSASSLSSSSTTSTGVIKQTKDSLTNQRRKTSLLKPGQLSGVKADSSISTSRSRSRSPVTSLQGKKEHDTHVTDNKKGRQPLEKKSDTRILGFRNKDTGIGKKDNKRSESVLSNKTCDDIESDNKSSKLKTLQYQFGGKYKASKPPSCPKGKGKVLNLKNSASQLKNTYQKTPTVQIQIQNATFSSECLPSESLAQNSTFNISDNKNLNSTFVKNKTIEIDPNVSIVGETGSTQQLSNLTSFRKQFNNTYEKELNNTYDKESNITNNKEYPLIGVSPKYSIRSSIQKGLVQSPPVPDLVKPLLCHESETLLDFAGEIMSEPDDQDSLTTSQVSHASSFGILSEVQISDNNLLTTVLEGKSGTVWNSAAINKCNQWIGNEIDDKELDLEIAGISTPEQDESSQSSTGTEELIPEPDVTQSVAHTTLELTFQVDQAKTSTPTSPTQLNGNGNANESQGVKPKLTGRLQKTFMCKSPLVTCNTNQKKPLNSTYTAVKDGNANEVKKDTVQEEYPKCMRTSSEFDNAENVLSASFELAKTAVTQYFDLVKGAEQEKALSLRKKDQRLSLIEIRSSSFDCGDISDGKKLRHSFHEDLLRKKPSGNSHNDLFAFRSETSKSFKNKPLELKHDNSDKCLKKENTDSTHKDIDLKCCDRTQTLDTHKPSSEKDIVKLSSSTQQIFNVNLSNLCDNSKLDSIKVTNDTPGEKVSVEEKEQQQISSIDDDLPSSELNTPGDYVELIKPLDKKALEHGVFNASYNKQEDFKGFAITDKSDNNNCNNGSSNLLNTTHPMSGDRTSDVYGNNITGSLHEGESISISSSQAEVEKPKRPLSVVSTGSVDTGVYSEDNGSGENNLMMSSREASFLYGVKDNVNGCVDRMDSSGGIEDLNDHTAIVNKTLEKRNGDDGPTPMTSSSSVDTGYQPDTESEQTESATTSSPTSVEYPTIKEDLKNSSLDEEKGSENYREGYDQSSTAIDIKELPEDMSGTECAGVTEEEEEAVIQSESNIHNKSEISHHDGLSSELPESEPTLEEVKSTEEKKEVEEINGEHSLTEMPELTKTEGSDAIKNDADTDIVSSSKETDESNWPGNIDPMREIIQNTIRETFITPDTDDEDVPEVPQNMAIDSENNEPANDNYIENYLHDANIQNENEEYFDDEIIPRKEDELESVETQSIDTEPPQKVDEVDMLDMSWDNTEFSQIRDKIINTDHGSVDVVGQNLDESVPSHEVESEDMEMECNESNKSVDALSSTGEGDSLTKSTKPQKRKNKSGFVSVKETKSSKLRSNRDSPEKVLEKDAKISKIGSPRKGLVSSKGPIGMSATLPTKLKKPSNVSGLSQQKQSNAAETSSSKIGPDKNKSAISKSQSRISSHLKKPSTNPTVESDGNTANKSHNPGESKIKNKSQTKSIQKRKTDSSATTNPVPSKKVASHSSNKTGTTANSSKLGHSAVDGLPTSRHQELNSSISSVQSTSSKVSVDSSENAINKKNPGPSKSRLATLSGKPGISKADVEGTGKGKSRSGLPQVKSTIGKKSDKEDNPSSTKLSSKKPLVGPSASSARSRLSAPGMRTGSGSRLVTSTPKAGSSSQHPSGLVNGHDITDLNVSDMSYNGSIGGIKSKTLTSKPPHRATKTLKNRDRSSSMCSDSLISVTSTVSTLSNISRVSSQGSGRPNPGRNSIAGTTVDGVSYSAQRSLSGLKKRNIPVEPKKSGLSVTAAGKIGTKGKASTSSQPLASSSPKKSNQNRNKTGVAGPTTRSSSHLTSKRSQQPTNLVSNSAACEEISRLEALCESRTKQLNYAKMQLKQSAAGFEAMSVLVRYLTEELDAFSLPEVSATLQETEERLSEAQKQLIELTCQRDALIEEIKCLKDEHQQETINLEHEHRANIQNTKDTITSEKQKEINELKEHHLQEISNLNSSHEKQIDDINQEQDTLLEEKHNEHVAALSEERDRYDSQLSELQKQHADALGDITKRFEDIKMNLGEKVECLRGECEMLRKREKEYMDSFQRDSDQKVQVALRPYQHLPQEIESLKAVMEMRNQEIHSLRRGKLEYERQLEALPKANEKIKFLQQKMENLEAIIHIRQDYERSLSEKHQVLLRKFDKESKANKRLSMENEEFVWRLSQGSEDLQNVLNRSISHSPTSSAASTPEPTRRKKSPHPPHSPRSPRTSGTDFDKYSQRSPRSSGLYDKRRSGRSNSDFTGNSARSSGSDFERIYSPSNSGNDLSKCEGFESNISQDSAFIMSTSTQSEPTSSSAQKGNLKRSGTYELLNEEAEMNGGRSPTSASKQTEV